MTEMNINYTSTFRGVRVIERSIYPTLWSVKSELYITEDALTQDINISLTKVDVFFNQILDSGVWYNIDNKWASKAFKQSYNNLVVLPSEPSDELLAPILQCKLNSISLNGIHWGQVSITSDTGGGLEFIFSGDAVDVLPHISEWVGDKTHFNASWWMRDDATTRDVRLKSHEDETKLPNWYAGFDFVSSEIPTKAEIIRPSFKPVIIDGHKE